MDLYSVRQQAPILTMHRTLDGLSPIQRTGGSGSLPLLQRERAEAKQFADRQNVIEKSSHKLPWPAGALEQHYTKAIPYGQLIMVMLQLRQLVMQPGQRIQLQEVNWHEFEAILDELGDKRACRIAYFPGFSLIESISQFLDRSQTEGRSQTLKAFRQWVREVI